jgi:hypothetical protein
MEAAMKVLFPIALAAGWITMVVFTMSDFASFYAAVHAHDLPVIQATETIIVTGKPKKRAVAECPDTTAKATTTAALHD